MPNQKRKKVFVTIPQALRDHPSASCFFLGSLYAEMRMIWLPYDPKKKIQRHTKAQHDLVVAKCIEQMDAVTKQFPFLKQSKKAA